VNSIKSKSLASTKKSLIEPGISTNVERIGAPLLPQGEGG